MREKAAEQACRFEASFSANDNPKLEGEARIMLNYIFGIGSLLAGLHMFVPFQKPQILWEHGEKYGEAPAQKMTRSLRSWGIFY